MPVITRRKARLQAQALADWAPLWCIARVALIFLLLQVIRLVSESRQVACLLCSCADRLLCSGHQTLRHLCCQHYLLPPAEHGLRWSSSAMLHNL